MIRWLISSSILVLMTIVGILVVYGNDSEIDGPQKNIRVAMFLSSVRNDHSWNESHYDALEKTATHLNLDVAYYENVPMDSTADKVMEIAISKGAEVIIATSIGFEHAVLSTAKKHPNVYFLHATGTKNAPNVSTFFGRIYQMRYLSGIVAGLKTKTNEIGYVAAFGIPEVNRGINAFALGVQKVNPNAKVFISWSHSWTDESMSTEATLNLLKQHDIDVLTVHVDALSPYEIADERGIWIIGYNKDNYLNYPKHFLTAPVWHWEHFYEMQIRNILYRNFSSQHLWLGIESGLIDLAPMSVHVENDIVQRVEREKQHLGKGLCGIFKGPIVDNYGELRVEKGDCMPDEELLEHFDWYIKGVDDGTKSQKY